MGRREYRGKAVLGKSQKSGRQHLQNTNGTEGELTEPDFSLLSVGTKRKTSQRLRARRRVWQSRGRWEVKLRGQMSGQVYLE